MTRFESIRYIHLRAEECGYDQDLLDRVRKNLETLQEEDLDQLKRISETDFRNWCIKINKEQQ
ncbi:hypothetical protein EXM22_14360 [Oceanispirochaeta crateris]|uniref:Uncharacterized protein n=1 Tax=Oceanispirochaeta crateris TaxID=2518645 RepID=A0A5C1QR57_9SPIO|nr:hypothetical protein [Oceanispirochaeta crateris]QEN09104.1 hypothetical protein EXM22_14360 [Oceanispirochaeta crateris]